MKLLMGFMNDIIFFSPIRMESVFRLYALFLFGFSISRSHFRSVAANFPMKKKKKTRVGAVSAA